MNQTTESIAIQFANFAGEIAENFSFNRSLGQIYGLLYIASEPMSLEDIANQLRMSKGNASINVRTLESWGAINSVWVSGSRKDHYEVNHNLKEIVTRRLNEGITKRLDTMERALQKMLANTDGATLSPAVKRRLSEFNSMIGNVRRGLRLLPYALRFIPKK